MNRFTKSACMLMVLLVLAVSVISQPIEPPNRPVDFANAAKHNSVLKTALVWKWGKSQKGWSLYVPLLKYTLGTEFEPDTPEFAEAVADWQASKGLDRTGVLNDETLYSFINYWQSRRVKPLYEAGANALLDAPISDFFDETRSTDLLKVDRTAYRAYRALIAAVKPELTGGGPQMENYGKFLTIISAYRSPEYQAELRKKEPALNRAQLAFRSPHFTGRALDIYVGGDPVSTDDENRAIQIRSKAYLWLVKNAEKFGFYPYFYEPWHWEYVGKQVED